MDSKKLLLKNVRVAFANLAEDEKYGKSIAVALTPEEEAKVKEWVKANKIGQKEPGVANIIDYVFDDTGETIRKFNFKVSKQTLIEPTDGLSLEDLGRGSKIDLIARAYKYENDFGSGISQSLLAVYVTGKAIVESARSAMEELRKVDTQETEAESEISLELVKDGEIDLTEIPF